MRFQAKAMLSLSAAAIVLAIPAPAFAADSAAPGNCPAGKVCFYDQPNYSGTMKAYSNPSQHTCGNTSIQPARSIWNNDDQTWSFYLDTDGCEGTSWEIEPGKGQPNTLAYNWK